MHGFKRFLTAVFLSILSISVLFSAAFAYLIVTPLGGKLLVSYFKQQFYAVGLLHVGHYQGSLQDGFILRDITIKGLSYIPDALLKIQEIRVRLPLWDVTHADFKIFNARIFIPDSDPIVFTGDIYGRTIKGNLYATSVDIYQASRFWAIEDIRKNLQGFASNIDIDIQGPLESPRLTGHFLADSIRYKSIVLTDGFSRMDLSIIPASGQIQVKGQVLLDSALVNVRKVDLDVAPSKFIFQGDIFNPTLEIHLGSQVEDMSINLTIKGTAQIPQLMVTSDPPMAPQQALQVLFTKNAWSSPTNSPFNGVTSNQLAQNFLDYSLDNINDDQQIGLKTKLTNNLKLGVEMDQLPSPIGDTNVYYSRKINGEMDLNEHMSLNISQEVMPQERDPSQIAQDGPSAAETQFYVQYKKRF